MSKSLNELRNKAFAYAERQGFHEQQVNLGECLMLVVFELSEALEVDRAGKWAGNPLIPTAYIGGSIELTSRDPEIITKEQYETLVRGTVEEEIVDAIIRLCDLAGIYDINLDWHVAAKMKYNSERPYRHGKRY